jgi:hypothetical protein
MGAEAAPRAGREPLLQELGLVIQLVQDQESAIAYRRSLLALLSDARDLLTRQPNEATRVRQIAFGLFRLVTDSSQLETGPIGSRLIALSGQLQDYAASVGNEDR